MDALRKRRLWVIILGLIVLTAISVGAAVSRQTALQNAAHGCDMGLGLQPGVQPVQSPIITDVELTTLGEAQHLESWPLTVRLRPAWVIHMQGKWLVRGGPPAVPPNPDPVYWYECISVVDALTGGVKSQPVE